MIGVHMKETHREYYLDHVRKRLGTPFLIFFSAFVMYVFLGLCLSYEVVFKNMFFGADNSRAFLDLTAIDYSHYRTKVHPLFPLFAETITLLVNGGVNRPTMSVILVESFCGALTLSLFWSTLKCKDVSPLVRGAFTFLFGASFSMMIFTTVPETFVFAALGLMSFWYLIVLLSDPGGPLSRNEEFLLICGGVACFGITLTNYISYLIGLTYLLLCRLDVKSAVKKFLTVNAMNALVIAALCKFQQFVWRQIPPFWDSIVAGLRGAKYEEFKYMNWSVNWDKTVTWLKQCVLYPLLSPDLYLSNPDVSFAGYPLWAKLALIVFLLIVGGCMLLYVYRMAKGFNFVEHGYILGLILALMGNLILHYIYGTKEAFMYSPHFLFLFLLAAAITLDRVENRNAKTGIIGGLLIFCAVLAGNNLWRYFQTVQLAMSTVGGSVFLVKAVKGTIMCGGLLFLGIVWWLYANRKKSFSVLPGGNPNAIVQKFARGIKVYLAIVFVVGLMIAYNW